MMLQPITDRLLAPMHHGFFTREGGRSAGIYTSLNGGPGSRDLPEAVAANRHAIAAHLGARALISVSQVHSDRAIVVTGPFTGGRPEADAMVTDQPGIALAALAADCAPVLLADATAGVVGAAHAGWRGALGGVIQATVAAMTARGASPARITAVVGPCISQRAYEVGPEFVERFLDEARENDRFFAGGQGDRAMFDLPSFVLAQLRAAEVGEAVWSGHCTYSDEARFFSYRRATHRGEPDYGRLVSAIALPERREETGV